MTYKTLVRHLKNINFTCDIDEEDIYVRNLIGETVVSVSSNEFCVLDTDWSGFTFLDDSEKNFLLNLCVEFARTPLNKR